MGLPPETNQQCGAGRFPPAQVRSKRVRCGAEHARLGQLLALENAAGVDAGLTVRVRKIASAVNQATGSRAPTGKYIAAIE